MLQAQDNSCAICGATLTFDSSQAHVDHCHDTKRVRGILCRNCNTSLGWLEKTPERLEIVIKYLNRMREKEG